MFDVFNLTIAQRKQFESIVYKEIQRIDVNRLCAFHRAIHSDGNLTRPIYRFAKGHVLQAAFSNLSSFFLSDINISNFQAKTPAGNARVLVRFNSQVRYHTPTGKTSMAELRIVIKNNNNVIHTPLYEDLHFILVVGLDAMFVIPVSYLIDYQIPFEETPHQHIVRINRFGSHVKIHRDTNPDHTINFKQSLSQHMELLMYSFSQEV